MPQPGFRRFKCPRCAAICYICSCCDRGQLYCGPACATAARVERLRRLRQAYARSGEGKKKNRARQAAFRARRQIRVTDPAPPEPPPPAIVVVAAEIANGSRAAASGIVCVVCGAASSRDLVRLDFIRRRGRVEPHHPGVRR